MRLDARPWSGEWYPLSAGGVRQVPGAAHSFLAFQNGGFFMSLGNRHDEFHQGFLALTNADSRSTNKGSSPEPFRVNGPSSEPICPCDDH